jgi:hypothetical protein
MMRFAVILVALILCLGFCLPGCAEEADNDTGPSGSVSMPGTDCPFLGISCRFHGMF